MILNSTRIFKVRPDLSGNDDMAAMRFAADILRKGGLCAFPTETVYGLGANALDEVAVLSIFAAKGRPQDNPLIVHVSKFEDMYKYCDTQNSNLQKLYPLMPGPLTVVLPKKDIIPASVCAGLQSVAMRIPLSVVARKLIELSGLPIAAPSANVSGRPSPTCAEHVIDDLLGKVDVIIDSGSTTVGVESTVVSLCTEVPTILRPGGITYEALSEILGEVKIAQSVKSPLKSGEVVAAPGMKYKHYAPKSPVYLLNGRENNILNFLRTKSIEENCAILCYDEDMPLVCAEHMFSVGSRKSPEIYAKVLFDHLRKTNEITNLKAIYARIPETTDGISLAVYNRLLKASGFSIINTDSFKKRIKILGLTGPTGAGKGEFVKVLNDLGYASIDTDKIAIEVIEKGKKAYFDLIEAFGRKILDSDKNINRKKMAEIVFSSEENLLKINKITHKYIAIEVCKILSKCQKEGKNFVCIDAPVLFDSSMANICDVTVGILASEEIRLDRIMARDEITQKVAFARMNAAHDDTFFITNCNYILQNNGDVKTFSEVAKKLIENIESSLV